ncbi:MAG: hypothetical protein QOJ69_1299 [Actinomycetota bacterium]|nr:hypothetical protein [Actinomycetota bacterium]
MRRPSLRAPALALALALALAMALGGCGSSPDATPGPTTTTPAPGTYGPPVRLGDIADDLVVESSGVVASRANPGRLWTHNDSDDGPVLYCLERDGRSCGRWEVTGASARDWEDIAAGPGPRAGQPYLYVGDIGDNLRNQGKLVIYRVAEPLLADPPAATGETAPAEAIRLRYEDGPHDAETLMVHPTTGDIYVVTKDLPAAVYKAAPGASTLTLVTTLQLGTPGWVTGGDISPDGRRVILCTLAAGVELALPDTPDTPDTPGPDTSGPDTSGNGTFGTTFDEIWAQPPRSVILPRRAQGEAIAYTLDGNAVVTTSELSHSPLHEVPRH